MPEGGQQFRGIQGFHGSGSDGQLGNGTENTRGDAAGALSDAEHAGLLASRIHFEDFRARLDMGPVVGQPAQDAGKRRRTDTRNADSRHLLALDHGAADGERRRERARERRVDIALPATAAEEARGSPE